MLCLKVSSGSYCTMLPELARHVCRDVSLTCSCGASGSPKCQSPWPTRLIKLHSNNLASLLAYLKHLSAGSSGVPDLMRACECNFEFAKVFPVFSFMLRYMQKHNPDVTGEHHLCYTSLYMHSFLVVKRDRP